ncbi:uncharacterized protein LOC120561398 isoform X2 [Perca fluviatilis]|uniref:uncharacterized protein LOC120561398 isoform X2 n=1 Tax=Perca fluviatilis TaxID=8168 RepID=UPI0019663F2D|nr:uncharacterized protein LOC120561398 isoform X2 [Perca fluviatilis]
MSSVQHLKQFVNERLTAAAEEIFGVFEKSIVEYEEEIGRQRRLLDLVCKPEITLLRIELPQPRVCKEEEEVLADQQQLCIQERNSSLDQEEPEPPQIKEEQEELCVSHEGEQLVLKQETDAFTLTPAYEERDHSEGQTLNFSINEPPVAVEENPLNCIWVKSSVVSEANSDHQLLAHNSREAESQDQRGGEDSGSTRLAELEPNKRGHCNNVNNPNLSEIHGDAHAKSELQRVSMDSDVCMDGDEPASSQTSTRKPKVGKTGHKCPICGLEYADLMQHLKLGEQVCNKTELDLLCKLAHRHFSASLDCPVRLCDSRNINRLDKHLQKVHKLGNDMVTLYVQKAKDCYIVRELALLRASRPHPPMVSHLDEIDEAAIEEGIRRKFEDPSSVPPASEVMSPSSAEPFATPSASVTPFNKPASGSQRKKLFRKNKPVLRTPSPRCKNCGILAAELKVVKELLESEVERNDELKQFHSSTSREKAVKYRRRRPFSPSKAPQYVKLVEEFKEHTEGSNPTRKIKENARQRANHVLNFLKFMSEPAVPHLNLLFLKDYGRIRKFTAHLSEQNLKPTTIRSYLTDAVAFVRYILSMAPEGVKIGGKSLNALLVELRARVRDVLRAVLGQQLAQRRRKLSKIT